MARKEDVTRIVADWQAALAGIHRPCAVRQRPYLYAPQPGPHFKGYNRAPERARASYPTRL